MRDDDLIWLPEIDSIQKWIERDEEIDRRDRARRDRVLDDEFLAVVDALD